MEMFWFVRLLTSLCAFRQNSFLLSAQTASGLRLGENRRNCGLLAGNGRVIVSLC